jgi:hypothetical protein
MQLQISYSKYNSFKQCPLKYAHQYIFKTKVVEEKSYPLILGQLTHLFIQLYNDEIYTKKQIREIKDNLEVLYELIDLQYPAFYNNNYQINHIDIRKSTEEIISYIKENEIVFFHALKLFNIYQERFFPKINQSSNFLSELTFNNITKINDELTCCFYGSIDLLFYNLNNDDIQYLYISDFKTGKRLYDNYFEQLFFYYYNLVNYNFEIGTKIKNNTDDINVLKIIKEKVTKDKVHLLLFNLREGEHKKLLLTESYNQYEKYINDFFNIIENDIYILHKDKEFLSFLDIYEKYNNKYKLVNIENCNKNQLGFTCNYCKFKDECTYRLIERE